MATWKRYGEGWVNLDQVETLEIREVDGEWQLTAQMPSGRTIEVLTSDDEAVVRRYAKVTRDENNVPTMLWLWRWLRTHGGREHRSAGS